MAEGMVASGEEEARVAAALVAEAALVAGYQGGNGCINGGYSTGGGGYAYFGGASSVVNLGNNDAHGYVSISI